MPPAGSKRAAQLAQPAGSQGDSYSSQPARSPSATPARKMPSKPGPGSVLKQSAGSGQQASGKAGASRAARPGSEAAAQHKQHAASLRQSFGGALSAHLGTGLVCEKSLAAYAAATAQGGKKGGRFRGVTRHKRTQRFEAHIWEAKKQIYLGGFDSEVLAAKSHDIMALKCKDTAVEVLNFSHEEYADLAPCLAVVSRDDVIAALRTYSKAQTAPRAPSIHQAAKGRVHKVQGGGGKQAHPGVGSPMRKLSLHTATSIMARPGPTGDGDWEPPSPGSQVLRSPRRMVTSPLSMPITPKTKCTERRAPVTPTYPTHMPTSPTADAQEGMASPFGSPFQQWSPRRATAGAGVDAAGGDDDEDMLSRRSSEELQGEEVEVEEELLLESSILLDEPSLTFSASEESRLYEWTPVDSAHSGLEHTLNGTVLFRNPAQREEHHQAAQALAARQLEPDGSGALLMMCRETTVLSLDGARPPSEAEVRVQAVPFIHSWPAMTLGWPWGATPCGAV